MTLKKELRRLKRHGRIRRKLQGTAERPRLSVHRSAKHLYAQVINDLESKTLLSFSTLDKNFRQNQPKMAKVSLAEKMGAFLATRMKDQGIQKVAFDRGGYKYHGRIKALAESLRQAGIQF